ncbi:phage tail protein [Streptococcus panodentis]|uniref:Uncharacterized protein n=1 Tax=Streptococcus panodentis TaxID=1581472 RepID=A0ABS5AX16_9STRE|nr:phage tail protein [Streptococcus panodentis]MBP2621118.1 hypothetical protein [Streptococcus panodentis]
MIIFIDESGAEYSALATYSVTNAVNGERSVSGTIYTNDKVLQGLDRGWRFQLDDEIYRVTYAKPNDTGRQIEVEFDAVHQFFYDFGKSNVYEGLEDGSHTYKTYLETIFKDSGYSYALEVDVNAIRKEGFNNKTRLSLFNDIITAAGLEFSVHGRVVRILKRVGTDLSTVVRKNFNMNELKIEKNINDFITCQRGLGAWKDENDHSKGRYTAEYTSSLARVYGKIEGEPVVDERYKETGELLARLKKNVDESYKISVEIDMEDLAQAGYRYDLPVAGDYIMAINETLGFKQRVRIVSFVSEYDIKGQLVNRKVTCNDIGSVQRHTSTMNGLSKRMNGITAESEKAVAIATQALVSADGKSKVFFSDTKPKGRFNKGDKLYLQVGDKTEMHFWNGSEWQLEPLGFDLEKFKEEYNSKVTAIEDSIKSNEAKAAEALQKAGAIVDSAELTRKINHTASSKIGELRAALTSQLEAYSRTETASQLEIVRAQMNDKFVAKSQYVEDLQGVKQRFDNFGVGGRNYIRGSKEMTIGTGAWSTATFRASGAGAIASVDIASSPVVGYAKAIRVTSSDAKSQIGICQDNFAMKPGTYTMSVWVKGTAGQKVKLQGYWSANDNTGIGPIVTLKSNDWTRLTFTSKTETTGNISIGYIYLVQSKKGDYLDVLAPQLEDGTFATANSEAPEDTGHRLSAQLAEYRTGIDGRFAELANVYTNKTEFQNVSETVKLYDRVIGTTEDKIKSNLARMTMTDSLFQTEVSKVVDRSLAVTNYVQDPYTMGDYEFWSPSKTTETKFLDSKYKTGLYSGILVDVKTPDEYQAILLPLYPIDEKNAEKGVTLSFTVIFTGELEFAANLYRKISNIHPYFSTSAVLLHETGSSTKKKLSVTIPYSRVKNDVNITELYLCIGFKGTGSVTFAQPSVTAGITPLPENYAPSFAERIQSIASTVQTQMNNSWAVKSLNGAGDIVSQINMTDGNVKIAGKLVHITGQTLIDDAAITSAKIKDLSADKITTGTLNAKTVNIVNMDAKSVTSGTFTGLTYIGGEIKALNDAMSINLNTAKTTYNKEAAIEFTKSRNSLYRKKDDVTAFLHFNDYGSSIYAALGTTSHNAGQDSGSSKFAGIKTFRSDDNHDYTEIYGDKTVFRHAQLSAQNMSENRNFAINVTELDKNYTLTQLIASLKGLWAIWEHAKNVKYNLSDSNLQLSIHTEWTKHRI